MNGAGGGGEVREVVLLKDGLKDGGKEGVVKEGSLSKRGEINKNWKVRWFILKDGKLFYFKRKQDQKPIGSIPLDQSAIRVRFFNILVKIILLLSFIVTRIFLLFPLYFYLFTNLLGFPPCFSLPRIGTLFFWFERIFI